MALYQVLRISLRQIRLKSLRNKTVLECTTFEDALLLIILN